MTYILTAHQPHAARPPLPRAPVTQQQGATSPGDLAAALAVGRAAEHFDIALYGLAAVLVLPELFFAALPPLQGLLAALGLLALGLAVRPLGTLAGQALQLRFGRTAQLTGATLGLGAASCLTALLPGSAELGGLAVALLVACRLLQGLAAGAAWDSAPSLLAMQVPERQRARCERLAQLGAPLGLALAAGLVATLQQSLGADDYLDWGWRFPFMVALAIQVVALFARLQLVLDDDHADTLHVSELDGADLPELLRAPQAAGLKEISTGVGLALAGAALAALVSVGLLAWTRLHAPGQTAALLPWLAGGALLAAAMLPLAGRLADRLGQRQALVALTLGIALLGLVSPWLLDGGESGRQMLLLLGCALFGLSQALMATQLAQVFPARRRHLGAALATDIAVLASAGLAPLALLALGVPLAASALGLLLLAASAATLWALQTALQPAAQLPDSLWWLKQDNRPTPSR